MQGMSSAYPARCGAMIVLGIYDTAHVASLASHRGRTLRPRCRRAPLDAHGYQSAWRANASASPLRPFQPSWCSYPIPRHSARHARQSTRCVVIVQDVIEGYHALLMEFRSACSTQHLLMSRRLPLAQLGLLHTRHVSIPALALTMDKL